MTALRLVHSRQFACLPWHLHFLADEPVQGASCRDCGRSVALPLSKSGEVPVCLYCGLESGLVEAVEKPFGDA